MQSMQKMLHDWALGSIRMCAEGSREGARRHAGTSHQPHKSACAYFALHALLSLLTNQCLPSRTSWRCAASARTPSPPWACRSRAPTTRRRGDASWARRPPACPRVRGAARVLGAQGIGNVGTEHRMPKSKAAEALPASDPLNFLSCCPLHLSSPLCCLCQAPAASRSVPIC